MVRSAGNPYMRGAKVAFGLSPGFRRGTGPVAMFNIAVAALVGAVSGHYIFKEPLENYWKEKKLEEARANQSTKPSTDKS